MKKKSRTLDWYRHRDEVAESLGHGAYDLQLFYPESVIDLIVESRIINERAAIRSTARRSSKIVSTSRAIRAAKH